MGKFFVPLLLCCILGVSLYLLWEKAPCNQPIEYSIGAFDERFGISQEELLASLSVAEAAWEKEAGRELFRFVPDAPFVVNLIYDERQERTEEALKLERDLQETQSRQETIGEQYSAVEAQYLKEKREYEALAAAFEARLERHNEDVEEWNRSDKTSSDEYESLEKESEALEKLSGEVEASRQEVNAIVAKMNTFAGKETALVEGYNSKLSAYTSRYGEAHEFDQGEYTSREINIYQFRDLPELRLVLSHELGHALGIVHVEDPASLMYYLMQDQDVDTLALTDEDRQALAGVCGTKDSTAFDSVKRTLLAPWRLLQPVFMET